MMSLRVQNTLRKNRSVAVLSFFLLFLPSCGPAPVKTTSLDVALTDGTHTAGGLIALDTDFIVLNDPNRPFEDASFTLIDYSLVDTITIIGDKYDRGGAVLGGLVGAIGGIFLSGALDSAAPNQERSRFVIGFGAGLVIGAGLGYFLGGRIADDDIVLAHPSDTDYNFLNQYAFYPDGMPRFLEKKVHKIESQNTQ